MSASFISVTETLALAEATAEFSNGQTFSECSDSTPKNCNKMVRPHWPRLALTRSKARCLRDSLNIHLVALEELSD